MNIFEQLIDKNGIDGFVRLMVESGVDETTVVRFMDIVGDDNGNIVYMNWLSENSDELVKEFNNRNIGDNDLVSLASTIINIFISWFDGLKTFLNGVKLRSTSQ